MLIRVTESELDAAAAASTVRRDEAGAVVVFLGVVRDNNLGRRVQYLVYDAYPSMAEKVMRQIAVEAAAQFDLADCAVLHRTGRLEIGEASLLITVSSAHRRAAFDGALWIVDEVKKRVPVWKKEVWDDGEAWIEGPEALGLQEAPASMR